MSSKRSNPDSTPKYKLLKISDLNGFTVHQEEAGKHQSIICSNDGSEITFTRPPGLPIASISNNFVNMSQAAITRSQMLMTNEAVKQCNDENIELENGFESIQSTKEMADIDENMDIHPCCKKVFTKQEETLNKLDRILREIVQLRNDVNGLQEIVNNKPLGEVGHNTENENLDLLNFPLLDFDQFMQFNTSLQEDNKVSAQFKRFLLSTSGKRDEKIIRNALSSIITDQLGCLFNWTGTRGGHKMSDKTFAKIFCNCFVLNKGYKIEFVEEIFKDWLRRSSDRRQIKIKKKSTASCNIIIIYIFEDLL